MLLAHIHWAAQMFRAPRDDTAPGTGHHSLLTSPTPLARPPSPTTGSGKKQGRPETTHRLLCQQVSSRQCCILQPSLLSMPTTLGQAALPQRVKPPPRQLLQAVLLGTVVLHSASAHSDCLAHHTSLCCRNQSELHSVPQMSHAHPRVQTFAIRILPPLCRDSTWGLLCPRAQCMAPWSPPGQLSPEVCPPEVLP